MVDFEFMSCMWECLVGECRSLMVVHGRYGCMRRWEWMYEVLNMGHYKKLMDRFGENSGTNTYKTYK